MGKVDELKISQSRATELANLISIACEKNKTCMECYAHEAQEPITLFNGALTCNESPFFDETCPNHSEGNQYEVISWLWHTDRPVGMLQTLRTLPMGYIAANHAKKELFIVFRGTLTSDEWKNNLITQPSSTIGNAPNLGKVHKGFNNIFSLDYHSRLEEHTSFLTQIEKSIGTYHEPPLSRQSSIKNTIHEKVINDRWLDKGYKIFITGHSLGGALAMLAGLLLISHDSIGYKPITTICTFGAPRVGNQDFGLWFDNVSIVRYVNTEDIVPTIPPPTSKLFGADMNESNSDKVKAQRQQGLENINKTFAFTQGAMNDDWLADDAKSTKEAFVHIGAIRSFTLNKGSISYNHNLTETYREGIGIVADENKTHRSNIEPETALIEPETALILSLEI